MQYHKQSNQDRKCGKHRCNPIMYLTGIQPHHTAHQEAIEGVFSVCVCVCACVCCAHMCVCIGHHRTITQSNTCPSSGAKYKTAQIIDRLPQADIKVASGSITLLLGSY